MNGRDAEATRGFEEDIGRWLTARDLLRRDRRVEERRELAGRENCVDDLAVRGRGDCERKRAGEATDGLDGTVHEWKADGVPGEQPLDDLVVDLVGRLREADHVVHVARPL